MLRRWRFWKRALHLQEKSMRLLFFRKRTNHVFLRLRQLEDNAAKKNELVMGMTKSSGSATMDAAVLAETRDEISKGWADGPWCLSHGHGVFLIRSLEPLFPGGSPWTKGTKYGWLMTFTLSWILHMIDTFVAAVKAYFGQMTSCSGDCSLVAKTYDVKSAYRHIPVRDDPLRYAYFCIYNHETGKVEVYRSRTLPFGATHSIYSFLRLAKMLHGVACRGPKLITANFYDVFILASHPMLQESAMSCMEMVSFSLDGITQRRVAKQQTSPNYVLRLEYPSIFEILKKGCLRYKTLLAE